MNHTITNPLGYKATASANNTTDSNQQTRGQLLYRRTSLSSERELLVKEAFSDCCSDEKEQLANDFIKEAKREGLNKLAEMPDGQYALAEVYSHAGSNSAKYMRRVHREQGNTAVNYTRGPGLAIADNFPGDLPGDWFSDWIDDHDFAFDSPDPAPESDDVYGGRDWGLGENPQLYVNGISYNDIRQGSVGDCTMLATIASVASLNPNFIRDAIIDNHNNTYTVRLYDSHGKAEYVTVDGELYRESGGNGRPVYGYSSQLNEIWPAIIEKAYATWEGGYANIKNRTATDTIMTLTGNRAHYVRNQLPTSMLYDGIRSALANGRPVVASSYDDPSRHSGTGIVEDHAYSVLRVYEENGQQWIVLRNPWGYREYQNANYETGGSRVNDGVFRMKFEDYRQHFGGTTY